MSKNFVSNKDESVRMFENSFLDVMSRVHWIAPLIVYVPLTIYFLYRAIAVFQVPTLTILGLFVAGFFAWTFAEYVLHRFVFHYEPPGKLGKRIHFVAHGVHHDYPNDSKRLVMPPGLSIPLCVLFYFLYTYLLGDAYAMAFFPGFIVGYLTYDMTHYALHHAKIKHPLFLMLKEHHMVHHYHDPENGFGVSSKLWDYIFGTRFKINKKDHKVSK